MAIMFPSFLPDYVRRDPFREAEVDILYGEGISREGDLLDLAVTQNILEKSGSWFSYKGERIGQGRENAKVFLKENPLIAGQIEKSIRENAGLIAEKFLERADPVDDGDGAAEA